MIKMNCLKKIFNKIFNKKVKKEILNKMKIKKDQ
jgi:hypothetical protein